MEAVRLAAPQPRPAALAQPLQFQRGRQGLRGRPRRVRLRMGHILFLLMLVAGLFVGVQRMSLMAFSSGAFALKSIDLVGASDLTRGPIQDIVAPRLGLSLFLLDADGLRADIAALSWVKDVRVAKSWPSRLRVTVRERTAMAILDGPEPVLVDEEGARLAPAGPDAAGALPLIRAEGGFADDYAGKIGQARECLSRLSGDLKRTIAAVEIGVPGRVGVELRASPIRLILAPERTAEGLAYFRDKAADWQSRFGALDYVDLTVPGRAFLGPGHAPEAGRTVKAGPEMEVK